MAEAKLRRFELQEIPDGFTNRHLSDTRYISRLAGDYLGLLYEGRIDADGTLRIQVSTGAMTAYLRDEWNLNAILDDGGDEKNRSDHRHHAIDAAVIAMNDTNTVGMLSRAAEQASLEGHRRFAKGIIEEPIPNFKQLVSEAKDKINVSFRANRKVSGGFHKETNYSDPQFVIEGEGKKAKRMEYRHIRKLLGSMTENEIDQIVDDTVKEQVKAKIQQLEQCGVKVFKNQNNRKVAAIFSDGENGQKSCELPYLRSKDGKRLIPIRKVRIRENVGTITVGKNGRQRHVASGNNHHMEIIALLDKEDNETKWEGVVVTMFEAYQRKRSKQPIIQRDHGPGKRFKFSLAVNEYVERIDKDGTKEIWRVRRVLLTIDFSKILGDSEICEVVEYFTSDF